jgi:hypothetical protein
VSDQEKQFLCVPLEVLRANLSPGAIKALLGLLSYRNRATGQCNPGLEKLAERLGGIPDTTMRRWLRELRQAGIVETVRHRGASAYVFHRPVFHMVENAETPSASSSQNGRSTPSTNGRSTPSTNGRSQPPHLYMNQIVLNQKKGNSDAAALSRPLRKSVETAAAATLPAVEKTTERPAAPVAGQLELKWDQPGLKPAAGSPGEPPSAVQAGGSSSCASHQTGELQAGEDPARQLRAQAEALVEELHADHPQPGLPGKAVAEVERILRAAEDVAATVELIRNNHAAWKAHWEILRPGAFIPQLWRWFRDGEWRREVRKPVRQETWYQRQDRLKREFKATEDILQPLYDAEMEEWRAKRKYA